MRLYSNTLIEAARMPAEHALGVPGPQGPVPGANRSPHLRWADFPLSTRSFAILCVDPDVPSRGETVNRRDCTVPHDLPRIDFYHWVLTDLPASLTELAEGQDADGLVPRGKSPGPAAVGVRGINDYTGWFAGDPVMSGLYGGYDGPWPPFNDERLHHYRFTVYALDVQTLNLAPLATGAQALAALCGHVLDQASITVTYSLYAAAKA